MKGVMPRYEREEYASRGDAIYEREIRPSLEPGNEGKFIAIDIDSGDFEIDADELAASDRLRSRRPEAQTWLRRVRLALRPTDRLPPTVGLAMITGIVTPEREAFIVLMVQGPAGQAEEIPAVIDTGFDGSLSLPSNTIARLGLAWLSRGRALLADGSESIFDIHEAVVIWDGRPLRIAIDTVDMIPLVGMSLLEGHELTIQVCEDGKVTIKPLP